MITKLDEYNPGTISEDPAQSRDLLKKLYQQLFPKSVRHDLGEYYTPDWLAEHVLTCIASNVGGVPEIISDQEDGLLVTPGSVDELRAAIKRLASDGAERERMGERAREKVRLTFELERCVKELKAILLQ